MLFYEEIQTIEKLGIRFAKFERAVGFTLNKSKSISLLIKNIFFYVNRKGRNIYLRLNTYTYIHKTKM